MKSKVVLCLSEDREKSFQVKRLFEHLGFANVASTIYANAQIPEGCEFAYIEYSYKNFNQIEKLAKLFNKKGVIFLVHSVEANEPFLRELQALYPLTMLSHVGLINLAVFRENINQLEAKYRYFQKIAKVRELVLGESETNLKKIIERNNNLSELVLNLLYHHKPTTYDHLLREFDTHKLSDFHFINFMKNNEGNGISLARLSRVSRKLSLTYFSNKCLAQRCLAKNDLVNYSLYCLESLNFNPFDCESLSGVIYSALVTGKEDCVIAAIKCRERYGALSIDDFNHLGVSVLVKIINSKQCFLGYVEGRRVHQTLLKKMIKKFGLGQKRYVDSVLELFFAYLTLRAGKDKAALHLVQRWDSRGYKLDSSSVPLIIKKTILVELGSLRESKRLFDVVANASNVKKPDGYMDIVRFNLQRYKNLLSQYKLLRENFEKITFKMMMGVYVNYPLSYEMNAIFSRKAILASDFIPLESVKKQLSNNIRCLNKTIG
ncbi:hypothetical protein [uncultured Vibrio sp.]|uniref:hypothetical protein n=1 Tax=uncultured Vibrio sp. TaxID=114054 RepID=UPI00261B8F05|nr:hypothetical protein [uncultured Vibrio sp.]